MNKQDVQAMYAIKTSDGKQDLYITTADSKDKLTNDPNMARLFPDYASAHEALCQFSRNYWHPLHYGSYLFDRADVVQMSKE